MHIVYLTHEYPKKGLNAGGIGFLIQFLARNLVKQNIRVSIIGISNESKDIIDVDGDISIYRLAKSNWKFGEFYDHTNRILSKIKDLDKEESVNIVEGSELNFAFFPRITSYKKIIRLHGGHHFFANELDKKPAIWRSFQEKQSFKKADGYIAVSDYVGRQTQKYLNFKFNYKVIYNSVDTVKFHLADITKLEQNTLLFVGTVCEKKGIRQLIQAMPLIKKNFPSIKLKIVGRDWIDKNGNSFTKYLKTYISEDLKNNIELLGAVPRIEIPDYIEKAHICVFPSHMESFGLVLLEALLMGKVVLASSIEPFKEIKGKEPIFELVNEITPENISKKVIELFNSKNETLKMGELTRKNIFKRFNIDTIIAENIQYYNKILS
jgi:glycosyltransferase involved in cell wall biosynthesis